MKRNPIVVIFRHLGSRIWFIVTTIVAVLLIVVTSLAYNRSILGGVLDQLFGGDRAVTKSGATVSTAFQLDDDVKAGDKSTSMAKSTAVTNELCDEGMVLLKNKNNALPIDVAKEGKGVSVFGHNSINMAISGSGSAGNAASGTTKSIYDSLTGAGFSVNPNLKSFYEGSNAGDARSSNPAMDGGVSTLDVGETPVANYASANIDYTGYKDVAIIFLTRIGGEGFDLPRAQTGNADKTFLDLDANEEAMIDMVTGMGFGKVVVLVNAANQLNCTALENNDKIDSILWMGFPGAQGVMSVGRILNGSVNPSGHLVDTYVKDFKSTPSYYNFGDGSHVSSSDKIILDRGSKTVEIPYYFVDYEEGVYVGYRYYETRGLTDGETWYDNNVLYPFGYGLSYTSFEWTLENESELTDKAITKDSFNVKVKVKNTGDVAGKEVVQIYMGAPYVDGQIEKSSKVLVGFEKTNLLDPGEEETLEITINPYFLASYDYNDANANNFKGYELDAGTYKFYLSHTAHDVEKELNMNVASNIQYNVDPVTGTKVENHFDNAIFHTQTTLSRKDFAGTFPEAPTEADRTIDTTLYNTLKNFTEIDPANPILNQTDVAMPTYGADNGMKLLELQGKSFDNEDWNKLLDQTTLQEQLTMYLDAGFHTAGMDSITKPKTTDCDGPVGLTNFMGDPTVYDTVTFSCEVITACTWNVDLAKDMGNAVGNEGIMGNVKGDSLPYTGWYAPAMNLHRSPFGGRVCEYFSEDPFISGKMGAAVVTGANAKGMTTYLKHFVGNEGETHRDSNGDITSVNEQALRELYMRPFEITVKEGKARGIMTSFNRLGTRWTGANYSLLTTVLREEWGFHGAVITDFNTHHSAAGYMQVIPALFAGGTLDLCSQTAEESLYLADDATYAQMLRNATHETLYAVVNSNAMANEIDHYDMAYWKIILLVVDIAVPVCLIAWGVFAILGAFKAEKKDEPVGGN